VGEISVADVGDFLAQKRAKSRRRCGSTKHLLLHENMLQRLQRRRGTVVAVGFGAVRCGPPRVVGSQAFYYANAFNQNLALWNVVKVTTFSAAFDLTLALSSCNKYKLYTAWGTTLRNAYPTYLTAPCVSSFAPVNIQVSSAATVTIQGAGFSSIDLSPSAFLSGQPCRTTTWTTATQLVCAAPSPSPVLATGARSARVSCPLAAA
jgi:hypothetical protein